MKLNPMAIILLVFFGLNSCDEDQEMASSLYLSDIVYHVDGMRSFSDKEYLTFYNDCEFTVYVAAVFHFLGSFFCKHNKFIKIEPKNVKKIFQKDLLECEQVNWKYLVFAKHEQDIEEYLKFYNNKLRNVDEYDQLFNNNRSLTYVTYSSESDLDVKKGNNFIFINSAKALDFDIIKSSE